MAKIYARWRHDILGALKGVLVMEYKSDIGESSEKRAAKSPEKQINTFDDLRGTDNSRRIDTFDDMRKQNSDNRSIKTFDDLRVSGESGDKTERRNTADKTVKDTPELTEQKRLDMAAEGIKKNEWMRPEKWKTLSTDEKRIALDHSGKALGKAYDSPEPPLDVKELRDMKTNNVDPNLQGTYGDGYSYRPESPYADEHGIVGADYGVKMNQEGMDPNTEKKLFGDDPRQAVETYGHALASSGIRISMNKPYVMKKG